MTTPPLNVPDWMLERYALGELSPDQSETIRVHLQAEAEAVRAGLTPQGDLTVRLEALQASDAAILEAHPPRHAAAEIRRRLHHRRAEDDQAGRTTSRQRRRWLLGGLVPAAVAALALIVVLPWGPDEITTIDHDNEIIQTTRKGMEQPVLQVWRETGSDEELLGQGAQAHQTDLLQLAYVAKGHDHGVILSVDGRSAVTLHFPAEPGGSTQLSLDGRTPLGFSYELDDAPSFERFFLVTSEKPIDVQTILDAATRLAGSGQAAERDLPLPTHLSQTAVRIDKVKR